MAKRPLAIALAFAFACTDLHAAEPVAEPVPVDAPPPADPLELLAEAARARDRGALDEALAAADAAVAADPGQPFAYLARAQIRLELARDPDVPPPQLDRSTWAAHLQAAADDLDRYLERVDVDAATRADLETQRDELRRNATARPAAPAPAPVVSRVPAPSTTTIDAPPDVRDRSRRRTGIALTALGTTLAAAGVGLATAGLRIERRCPEQCSVRWTARPALLAPSVVGSLLGTGLVGYGTDAIARHHPSTRPSRARAVAGVLLGLGGGALVGGVTTLAIAGARWRTVVPSDGASLSDTQRLANAGVAASSAVPALVAAGIGLLVGARARARRTALARR